MVGELFLELGGHTDQPQIGSRAEQGEPRESTESDSGEDLHDGFPFIRHTVEPVAGSAR